MTSDLLADLAMLFLGDFVEQQASRVHVHSRAFAAGTEVIRMAAQKQTQA